MATFISQNSIRAMFAARMSDMYRAEVPLYGELLELVESVNRTVLDKSPALAAQLQQSGELERISLERHGAIRLGTAAELATMRRLFAVMGMYPVGYYDLAPAGVPVHSTAFRALDDRALNDCPFRVFTSLLRLDLIQDEKLAAQAEEILAKREIFTPGALELIAKYEQEGGLTQAQAETFVNEAVETFRWHDSATVSREVYEALLNQHRLIADVVAFRGPHINHLTPRTLDIDAVQRGMSERNIPPKAVVEGPPARNCPILLRQTSFKALNETVSFLGESASHTARFGEIEQRGVALTDKGRALYDRLLAEARASIGGAPDEQNASEYERALSDAFAEFPDSYAELYQQKLAYFHFYATDKTPPEGVDLDDIDALLDNGCATIAPVVYEDFLPVSAAGIFQSNLGDDAQKHYDEASNQAAFERDLGCEVVDLMAWYE
ncbi:MAG: DUF1338 domain-containing protein, partial [Gammaproteobacteria bacterium]